MRRKRRKADINQLSLEEQASIARGHLFAFVHGGSHPDLQGSALKYLDRVEEVRVLDYTGDEVMQSEIAANILLSAFKKKHPDRSFDYCDVLTREIDRGLTAARTVHTDLRGIKNRKQFQKRVPRGIPNS